MNRILEVKNLTTEVKMKGDWYKVINNVSFYLDEGETLGIVGESGCGKSMTSLSIMGLLPAGAARIKAGEALFEGQNLLTLKESGMQSIRGKEMAMIFQDPMISLNPVLKIGYQMNEVLIRHLKKTKKESKEISLTLLKSFGIKNAERVYQSYPFQLSGGMCQRVMIAMAMACNPRILIADEPTTALDVTLQAQILDLIHDLKDTHRTSVIMISHNLGVIAKTCDRVMVMYRGEIVEQGTVDQLFDRPLHPYTEALFKCIPRLDVEEKLTGIALSVPALDEEIIGCAFAPRCPTRTEKCLKQPIPLEEKEPGHYSRCLYEP